MKKSFDKYFHYLNSVQSPEVEAEFLHDLYKKKRKRNPESLREDFCGTYILCCEWVKRAKNTRAVGIDLDAEPLKYGNTHHLSALKQQQQDRIQILQENVLSKNLPKTDIACALNFSYFIFKQREKLKAYFKNAFKRLNNKGIFVIDCFGGSKSFEPNEEETAFSDLKFSYFWDQTNFDPITNFAKFYIHFKRRGESKRNRVFTYDWRMWSIPELKDILYEVGFKDVCVYWEGTTSKGEGNGIFKEAQKGEACEAWVAYLVALK